jgi:hypothetical protein
MNLMFSVDILVLERKIFKTNSINQRKHSECVMDVMIIVSIDALICLTGGMGTRLERLLFKEPLEQHSSFLTHQHFQKFTLPSLETLQEWKDYCYQIKPGIVLLVSYLLFKYQ